MYGKINNPKNYQAALYLRLSKEDENEGPSQSITNQQSLLSEFARRQNLIVYDTYIDDGYSGTDFDRPAFKRLLADIEDKKINMVLTKDLSRLGRDYILTGYYMEKYFPEHKVRYISLLDGIDTGIDSSANDITPFKAIMNDMYAKDISKKIKSVKQDKQQKGLFIGAKPMYGYKMHPTEKNKIVIDPEAAKIVKRIFAYALEGLSCRQIALILNKEQIPSPAKYCGWELNIGAYSGKWSSERISAMLQNETYLGNMVQGKSAKASYKSKKCLRKDKADWIVVENTHEPLIDRESFQKIQLLLASRRHTRSRKYDFLFKGLIFCHECGFPLAVINRQNSNGADCLYFVCRTYQRFGKSCCSSHCLKEEYVNEAVTAKIKEICQEQIDLAFLEKAAQKMLEELKPSNIYEAESQALAKEIASLNEKIDKIYLDQINGILLEEDFKRLYQQIKQQRIKKEEQIKELRQKMASLKEESLDAEKIVAHFLNNIFSDRQFLISIIERIELTKEKNIILKLRFKEELKVKV